MRWPREQLEQDRLVNQNASGADEFIQNYQKLPWREKAVSFIQKSIKQWLVDFDESNDDYELPSTEQIIEWLNTDELSEAANHLSENSNGYSSELSKLLIVEALGNRFCNRPSIARWKIIGQIISNNSIASMVLISIIQHRMKKDTNLCNKIRKIARKLVHNFVKNPSRSNFLNSPSTLLEIHEQWTAQPELHEIWFGLRSNHCAFPFRSDYHIFDLLFELDTEFAVELIEDYGSPFQPATILSFGRFSPHRRFAHWEQLIKLALPAFKADGTWNHCILLPLLLHIAQDSMQPISVRASENGSEIESLGIQLRELADAVATPIWTRPDASATALRWSAWLFRSAMSKLDGEQVPFPQDAQSRAYTDWMVIQALGEPKTSVSCLDLNPIDVASEDEFCIQAVQVLVAERQKRDVPGRDFLLQLLPDEPEQFLDGDQGKRMRRLPSLFVIWGKRPDAIGTRVLATALFDEHVDITFKDLWHRTLVLREIAEHYHAFRSDNTRHDDGAMQATQTLRFLISIGINLIDYVQDSRYTVEFEDRHATALALFSILHDATRELLAIDVIGHQDLTSIHNQLCVRRFLYEKSKIGELEVAAPLNETDRPTAGDLLFERSGVSRSFFDCLQMLFANEITQEQITGALGTVGVDIVKLVREARRLNAIEHSRTINLDGFET